MPTLTPDIAFKLYRALGLDPNLIRSVTLKLVPGEPISMTYERAAEDFEIERAVTVLRKEVVWRNKGGMK